jgi:DDE_Tnp_1-associated
MSGRFLPYIRALLEPFQRPTRLAGGDVTEVGGTDSLGGRLEVIRTFPSHLATIPDPRRAEGKLYQLPHVLVFSILAIVSGANSSRGIRTFIKVHRRNLNKAFKINWKKPPAYAAIRYILQGLSAEDVERAFREHAANLNLAEAGSSVRVVAFDGKTLKGSFDNFNDAKAKTGAQRVRRRYGAGSGAYRNRREVQRNPGRTKAVTNPDKPDHILCEVSGKFETKNLPNWKDGRTWSPYPPSCWVIASLEQKACQMF